jgi:hypothetical protein
VEEGATRNVDPIDETTTVTIQLKVQSGELTLFQVRRSTRFVIIMHAYAARKGVHADQLRFWLEGDLISPSDTPAGLSLEDEDQVDVMLAQCGC